jgi:hypothetical protein
VEDDQIITAAAYLTAFRAVINARELTSQQLCDELAAYGENRERIARIVNEYEKQIHDMVGVIYDATIPT